MVEVLLLSVLIIAIAIALLSVKLIFKKNGKFASPHIHDNAGLRKKRHTLRYRSRFRGKKIELCILIIKR